MFWADKIAADAVGEQVVNDSKTPSGRVHVGSLRGVVIHDVIYRALKHAGKPVKFLYGVDDYDALDTVPKYLDKEKFQPSFIQINSSFELLGFLTNYNILMIYVINTKGNFFNF